MQNSIFDQRNRHFLLLSALSIVIAAFDSKIEKFNVHKDLACAQNFILDQIVEKSYLEQ